MTDTPDLMGEAARTVAAIADALFPPAPLDPPDDSVFVIEPIVRRWRYLLTGGHILDVDSPYYASSDDRAAVLREAQRRWGGRKDDWKIEGVVRVP